MRDPNALSAFFSPASIAIIGASDDAAKIGGRPIRNLLLGGYAGHILPINPRYESVQGLKAYRSIGDVREPIDLAIISLPAAHVPEAVEACAEAGVKGAIIFSAGFSESGRDGEKAQARIEAIAHRSGLRLLGPNCMGTINTRAGVLATFTSGIVEEAPKVGRISLASQSGAFGSHCLALMRERGLALNLWATTGNQCDVEVADFLAYMADDPDTDVVIGSIEGVRDAAMLVRAFEIARRNKKPLIIMKVGTSDAGMAAMASHTASLAGSDAVFDAVLRRYGVYRARTIDELMDVAYACSRGRLPSGRGLGVVTASGGVGVLMADAAAEFGIDLTEVPAATQSRLKALVPFAGTRNPLDVTAQILNNPDLIEPMLTLLIEDGGYASVVIFLSHLGLNPSVISKLMPGLKRAAERFTDRNLSMSLLAHPDVRDDLEAAGYTVFEDPTRAVRAAHALSHFSEAFERAPNPMPSLDDVPQVETDRPYSEFEAKRLLGAAGIPVSQEMLAADASEAVAAARRIGFPVVLKIVSADIAHKSEIGGVLLGIQDEEAVREGFGTLLRRAAESVPSARIDGVLVATMIPKGVETVLGVVRDPLFGPVVMFGLGGIFVEVLRDVVFRPAPFGIDEAREMIGEVRGSALLRGARGSPPCDIAALAEALSNLSRFAAANAERLASVDINPFVVLPVGEGAFAVDAFIETGVKPGHPVEGVAA